MNTKKLSQLEVLESAEGTHVLVEQNGEHKRVPAEKIGSGGGTPNAVQYTAQELTEEQQMQARANLGLYRKEGGGIVPAAPLTMVEVESSYEDENGETVTQTETVPMIPGFVPVGGQTYTVTWNGTDYACTAAEQTNDGETGVILGNLDLMMGTGDTGEPFVMVYAPTYVSKTGVDGVVVMPASDTGDTIPVVGISGETIRKIPREYLEKTYYPVREQLLSFTNEDMVADETYGEAYIHAPIDLSWVKTNADGKATNLGFALYIEGLEESLTRDIYWHKETDEDGGEVEVGTAYVTESSSEKSVFLIIRNSANGLIVYDLFDFGTEYKTFAFDLYKLNGNGGIIPEDCIELSGTKALVEGVRKEIAEVMPYIVTGIRRENQLVPTMGKDAVIAAAAKGRTVYLQDGERRAYLATPVAADSTVNPVFNDFYLNDSGQLVYRKWEFVAVRNILMTETVLATAATETTT